uniref:Uncharacterized protein n=1 Tax=Arundo donax TaxID=35708 RepID=A0A0A9SL83_ARUDO
MCSCEVKKHQEGWGELSGVSYVLYLRHVSKVLL